MTSEELKADCETQYEVIKKAEERLKELRKMCPHDQTFEGNWSYRIGSILPAIICFHCGSLIRYKDASG